MARKIEPKRVVIVHQAPTGRWYATQSTCECLHEDGPGYRTVRELLAALREDWAYRYGEITHYKIGSKLRKL